MRIEEKRNIIHSHTPNSSTAKSPYTSRYTSSSYGMIHSPVPVSMFSCGDTKWKIVAKPRIESTKISAKERMSLKTSTIMRIRYRVCPNARIYEIPRSQISRLQIAKTMITAGWSTSGVNEKIMLT